MSSSTASTSPYRPEGGGALGELIRAKSDWHASRLGPPERWPQSLRTALGIVLSSRFPMFIFWGPDLCILYNDAYAPILGAKHPDALGGRGVDVWHEIWDVIGPMLERVLRGEEATWSEDQLLVMNRRGFVEETYFTWSYSPIRDETGGVGGVFAVVAETTARVIGARRLLTLRELGEEVAEAKTVDDACARGLATLSENAHDVPFAAMYLLDEGGQTARLAAAHALEAGSPAAPREIAGGDESVWPLASVARSGVAAHVERLPEGLGALPGGPWPGPASSALVLPVAKPGQPTPYGVLVAGLSPRLALDEAYETFLRLSAGQIAGAIANAVAYEEERRRAEALAEIDRAKTAFFGNVSHEFRTPLTLMLGPLEDALASPAGALAGEALPLVHRNALRLLKLVNTLLDFSRIEAGRAQASYEPADLSTLTADAASAFRAAVEQAGLAFVVDCPKLPEPVFVDRDMWEKIVLNLVSNAFKFTFAGEVRVELRWGGDHAVLVVRDTGAGVPEHELPRLFERFHRVQGARSRTHEGSGIGLALVHELVRLHGGSIRADSVLGEGTAFAIAIPRGSAHLPRDRVCAGKTLASTALGAAPYVEEALRWLPDAGARAPSPVGPEMGPVPLHPGARILLADDNADMRVYVQRILGARWAVEAVGDGVAALASTCRARPDLVLTDVMMPGLDGFGLLRALRANPATRGVPVILLSARAGEESRVEGLEAGADDYLVKPFSARELVARVATHLQLSMARRALEAAKAEREALLHRAEDARREAEQANRAKDEFLAMLGHELRNPLAPIVLALNLMRLRSPGAAERERVVIERQVQHLSALVDDLLDVSRITRGKVTLARQRVEIAEAVSKGIELASPLLEQRRHHLSTRVPLRGLVVDGDVTRLAQVVSNLVGNAAKYTERGGRISVEAELRPGEVVLRVRDDGIGIAPEMLPHVFDLFAQEHQALDRSQGGLGLGLAIVRSLVGLHGGRVSAHSEGRGRGSEFTIVLPAAQPLAPEATDPSPPPARAPSPPPSPGHRVLVVDDNPDAAELLSESLRMLGYTLRVAHDGPSALRIAEAFAPDVALLDIGLPVMDGYELARRLREQRAGAGVHLVAITGYGQDADRRRSEEAGFGAHLVKPVQVERVQALLETLLCGSAAVV